ncbi:MAG: hypothetical protein WDM87_06260 [Terracidiphilus sp.]
MSAIQVEQKTYEMPPREGISIAHFLTVADIELSAHYYEKVFDARILSMGDGQRACIPSACQYLDDSERGRRPDAGQTDGNGQRSPTRIASTAS